MKPCFLLSPCSKLSCRNILFCDNHSYKNAWCTIGCLNHHKELLRQADVAAAAAASGEHTDMDREVQLYKVSGKLHARTLVLF